MKFQYPGVHMPIIGILFGSVALSACMLDEAEQLQTGTSDQPILLSINGPSQAGCEGFTSGGGQKVRGHVDVQLIDIASSTWRATMTAENWKKNIGWNTKRTTELRIVGSIATSMFGARTLQCDIDVDSGGELTTLIGFTCDYQAPSTAITDARLTFFGRDGTVCAL